MTVVNRVPDVNDALANGLSLLMGENTITEQTRNGPVVSADGPVVTETIYPAKRVLFSPLRRANPFFHLMESLWMLAGRNDLPWLTQFNRQMKAYSDDGGSTQPGAYGHRWRAYFGYDQLNYIIFELRERPNSRRAVLAMWNAGGDRDNSVLIGTGDLVSALTGTADVPCNTHCYFRIREDAGQNVLDMAVSCRSNDVLWGAHGANAVHFSVMMEYVAAHLGVGMGKMTQFSFNYHVYPNALKHSLSRLRDDCWDHNLYRTEGLRATPLFTKADVALFDSELEAFMGYARPLDRGERRGERPAFSHPLFTGLAVPMLRSWDFHKRVDYSSAIGVTHDIVEGDWQRACKDWMLGARDIHDQKEQ